jgi:hypothetical protein
MRWNFREYRFLLSTRVSSPGECAHRECANSRGHSISRQKYLCRRETDLQSICATIPNFLAKVQMPAEIACVGVRCGAHGVTRLRGRVLGIPKSMDLSCSPCVTRTLGLRRDSTWRKYFYDEAVTMTAKGALSTCEQKAN